MSRTNIALTLMSAMAWIGTAQAQTLNPSLSPGQNFDLSAYTLQTLDGHLQFKEVSPIGSYQDAFFFTDPTTGAMIFRVPSGAGHSKHSEFPRVELRENKSWIIGSSDGVPHTESIVLRVLAEPLTGELIFAQIHGEKTGGSEALKMRWSHGDIVMGVKQHYGDKEERIPLLHGLSLNALIACQLELVNNTLTVHVQSGTASATHRFSYAADSWKDIPVYYKVGNYSQDKEADGSVGSVAVEHLQLSR